MKWQQKDAAQRVRDIIRKHTPPEYHDLICDEVPKRWSPEKSILVTVTANGTPTSNRAWTTENVHVAVRSRSKPNARSIMAQIDASMIAPRELSWGLRIKPATGLIVVPDSKFGGYVASVTYRVSTNRSLR